MSHESSYSLEVGIKVWLKGPNNFTLGPGDAALLKALLETSNLTNAAKACGYSYKYAWQKLKTITNQTSRLVAETKKGGYGGGGEVHLTEWGRILVEIFDDAQSQINSKLQEINSALQTHLKKVLKT
jgi:molybdate transport system regulatory protein